MSSVRDITFSAIVNALLNSCENKPGLAINAASAATIKTTSAPLYTISGAYYNPSALSAQSFAPTHNPFGEAISAATTAAYVQPAGTTVIYLVALNAAGQVAIVQGSYAGQVLSYTADKSKNVLCGGGVPVEPAGYTTIGAVKVVAGSASFTPGTTALDAAGLTVTYFDINILPTTL